MAKRPRFQIPDRDPKRPKVPDVLPLVRELYALPGCEAGGPLHVVLDDGNLDDWCLHWAIGEAVLNYRRAPRRLTLRIIAAMLQMTMTQRRRLYRLAHAR